MKIELVKFKRFWAVLALVGILTIFGAGLILLKNAIGVFAQDGDFVGDLTSTLTIRQQENGVEKTGFMSGELIELSSIVRVNGDNAIYNEPYVLYKIPRRFLREDNVIQPNLALSKEGYIDGDFKVWKVKYANLSGGSVAESFIRLKTDPLETPLGYDFEIIQEVYSNSNTLLSRKTKRTETLKQPKGLKEVHKGAWNLGWFNWRETVRVPSVTYTDATNTTLDQESWSRLGVIRYEVSFQAVENNGSNVGRNKIKHYKVTDFLPEHMELTEDSVRNGWTYDATNHSATKIVPASSNYQIMGTGAAEISLRFKNTTPASILDTVVVNNANVEIEYADGDKFNENTSGRIMPTAIRKVAGEDFSFEKKGAGGDTPDRRWIDGKYASNVNTVNTMSWDIYVTVKNQGNEFLEIDKIVDDLPPYLKPARISINGGSAYKFYAENPLEFYATDSNGVEKKINDLYGDRTNTFTGDEDIRSIRFSPKNGKVPGYLTGQSQYTLIISINAYVNQDYIKNLAVQPEVPYAVNNTAIITAGGTNVASTGTNYIGRWPVKLENRLSLNSRPWYNNGAAYKDGDVLTTGYSHWWHLGVNNLNIYDINKIEGANIIYTFPQNMEFTPAAQEKIRSGAWIYYRDYKNTGKSAVVQKSDFSNVDFLRVGKFIKSGTYEVEKITIWKENLDNYGDGPDDLDFHDDGNTTTRQVARSKGTFIVDNPLFISTHKQVRSLEKEDFFSESTKIKPGDRVEYRMSVINYDQRALNDVRSLEILPYAGDKSIVRDNFGSLADRGSNIAVKMTGPVVDLNGKFNVFYSTEAPGANEDESYAKNFVPADQITDWSAVRMIKFEQKADQEISAQNTVSLTFSARVDENAPDQSVAVNTFATGLSGTSKLNEGNAVKLTVIYDAKIRGVAFEDMNGNGVFDRGVDTLLSGYKAKLMKGDQVVAEKITGDNGGYEILTDKFADGYKIQFEKPDGDIRNVVESQMNNGFEDSNASNLENKETLDTFIFNLRENGEKEVVRNIGLFTPRGSVRVKFQTLDGIELKTDQIPFENRPVSEQYSTEFLRNQNSELVDANGLRYQFSKRKEDSAQETGLIEPGEKTVVYQYEPMAGSIVTVKYVIRGTQTELASRVVVKPQGTQVGTPFTAPYERELTDVNGLVYTQPALPRGYDGGTGRVSVNPIHLVVSYIPKTGGVVEYGYETETGEEILAPTELNLLSRQIGAKYSHAPDLEVKHKGITYVLKGLKDGSAPQNGTIKNEDQLITYVFVPKKGGQVVANYFDEEGNLISNTSIVSATNTPVGTDYQNTPPAEITNADGLKFTYKELGANSAPQNSKVKAETQEIRYIYAKKLGKGVISKFIDEDGNEISPDVEVVADGAQVGTRYSAAHQNEITKGNLVFEFKEILQNSAPQNGKTTEDSQAVTFVYRKKLGGKVTAKFVDLDGNGLKDPIEVAPEGQQVGTEYSSTKENEIEKDGLVYIFEVLAQNSAPENGRIKSDAQEVIYAYAPKKGGSVTAKFLDKNGVEIQIPEVIKPRGTQVGTPYESTSKDKIVINGKTYILREVKGEQTGKVSDGDIVIEYIFELEENPAAILAPNTGFMAGVGGLLAVIAVSIASFFTLKKKSRI